jgi:hypothetical protein
MVEFLLHFGADPGLPAATGWSARERASRRTDGLADVVKAILAPSLRAPRRESA